MNVNVKAYVSWIHIGLLELTTLVFIVLIWAAGFYEAYFLTKIQFLIYKEPPGTLDYVANSIPIIIGSLAAMVFPSMVLKAKSTISLSGSEVSPMELFLITLVLLLAFTMPMLMWYKCMTALDEALRLKLMTASQYNLRKSTIVVTISANMGVDFILGLWSIYELQKDNGKLKTHKVKNPFKRRTNSVSPTPVSTTRGTTSSSTTPSTPKGSSIPVKSTEENKAATVVPVTKSDTEVSPNL